MRRFRIPSTIVSTWLLISSHALAGEVHQYAECHRQPSENDIQGAKGAFQAGNVSFKEADYERAILYWEDAFRRDCTATLLLHHLARAYEGQGNLEQAIVALKAYLERAPNVAERPQIQRRIEVFEQRLEDERQRAIRAAEEQKAKHTPTALTAVSPVSASGSGKRDLHVNPIIPIAVSAVGMAATIVGAIIYFPAKSDVSRYESLCSGHSCSPVARVDAEQEADSARSRRNWGAGVGITGLVLVAGGVGWYFFNEKQRPTGTVPSPQHAFRPWVGTQLAGLSYSGNF